MNAGPERQGIVVASIIAAIALVTGMEAVIALVSDGRVTERQNDVSAEFVPNCRVSCPGPLLSPLQPEVGRPYRVSPV